MVKSTLFGEAINTLERSQSTNGWVMLNGGANNEVLRHDNRLKVGKSLPQRLKHRGGRNWIDVEHQVI